MVLYGSSDPRHQFLNIRKALMSALITLIKTSRFFSRTAARTFHRQVGCGLRLSGPVGQHASITSGVLGKDFRKHQATRLAVHDELEVARRKYFLAAEVPRGNWFGIAWRSLLNCNV